MYDSDAGSVPASFSVCLRRHGEGMKHVTRPVFGEIPRDLVFPYQEDVDNAIKVVEDEMALMRQHSNYDLNAWVQTNFNDTVESKAVATLYKRWIGDSIAVEEAIVEAEISEHAFREAQAEQDDERAEYRQLTKRLHWLKTGVRP